MVNHSKFTVTANKDTANKKLQNKMLHRSEVEVRNVANFIF